MGSNEVIIDGVNVAECNDIYGKEWINPQCLDGGGLCKYYPNCYFKQLQRAKADVEELKEYNDSYDIDVRALLSEKEQENKNLKNFVVWLLKQQYYILPLKIKEKCKELLTH